MTRPLVVVLGASGYVGSVVTGLLARRPVRLRAVARGSYEPPEQAVADVEVVPADLTDRARLAEAVAGADAVLHFVKSSGSWRDAERDPAGSAAVTVGVMRDLVDVLGARPEPPLVVFAGAASQVGRPPDRPLDGSEPDEPDTEYDRQKLAAERVLLDATAAGAVRGVSLRLPTVFGHSALGAADDVGVVSAMTRRALRGEPITMWHDGTVARDVTYVEDVAAAFLAALDRPDALVGRHWLVGAGRGDRLGDVFRLVARSVARHTGEPPVEVVSVPPPAGAPDTDFLGVFIDPEPFGRACGWSARVPLAEAVDRTVSALLTREATRVRT
ncbi:NAD-dependent epimerase/dehydratase [Saccharothrix syringae]|uniref:SDR family epimerase/dehydratase n=1 Tax=Saccharothrix syringae TaxID=103733 RepID=A0A5Q0H5B7_SACSY|nr:NAD-dependent epimerase/dehydratase [Saccharothrix syringae]QFZ21441.1 SDR family epimerase/dehydratase [Saccharothrix syringae]